MKLALTEACSNSVRHAYEQGHEGNVAIRYELGDDRLVVEVQDEGGGFEPEVLAAANTELDEGGLGIAIIRAVTDEFEIGRGPEGQGSRLRFVKYLA
jgi:serine/threonine-protein kinase RsbW